MAVATESKDTQDYQDGQDCGKLDGNLFLYLFGCGQIILLVLDLWLLYGYSHIDGFDEVDCRSGCFVLEVLGEGYRLGKLLYFVRFWYFFRW